MLPRRPDRWFHEAADRSPDADLRSPQALLGRWAESVADLRRFTEGSTAVLSPGEVQAVRTKRRYVRGRAPCSTIASGRARRWPWRPAMRRRLRARRWSSHPDCIEFSGAYRWGDVLADVAFLAMDLGASGASSVKRSSTTTSSSGDRWPSSLMPHIAYRARARQVACLRHGGTSTPRRGPPAAPPRIPPPQARHHPSRAGRRLARHRQVDDRCELGTRLGAMVLSTDEVRKDPRHGRTEPAARPHEGLYT
jgi:hypothetical protein